MDTVNRTIILLSLFALICTSYASQAWAQNSELRGSARHSKPIIHPQQPALAALNSTNELEVAAISKTSKKTSGSIFPSPALNKVPLRVSDNGRVWLPELPDFDSTVGDRYAALTSRGEYVFYSIDPGLQKFAAALVKETTSPHVALVAMDPQTGRILAASGKSPSIKNILTHAGFPAASLFKIVTAAAAVEKAGLGSESMIAFRGSDYTLNLWNFAPGQGRDSRSMSLGEALGRSCNPVFSRVALSHLSPEILRSYAFGFGFNNSMQSDVALTASRAVIPDKDFDLGRTAAGFGEVTISPIHAATLVAGIAHNGLLPRPALIDKVVSPNGAVVYEQQPEMLNRIVSPTTAKLLLNMMEQTTTIGTSKRAFITNAGPLLPDIDVAAKTGTLKGTNPEGINNWFIAAAPIAKPTLALAVIVVHPGGYHIKASQIGRMFIQKFFNQTVTPPIRPVYKKAKKKFKKSFVKKKKQKTVRR